MKRRITITYRGVVHKIAWHSGTSDGAIRETIKEALGFAPEVNIVLKDSEDVTIAINQYIPDGSSYVVEQRTSNNETIIDDPKGPKPTTSANSFRGELLKFERINAHLANERTWLAWVRTALSTLSCAFAFLSLSSSGIYSWLAFGLGSVFCLVVLLIYITGWLRYSKVKLILGLSFNEMKNQFDRVGVHWVASALGVLFVATSLMYWIGVFQDIKGK